MSSRVYTLDVIDWLPIMHTSLAEPINHRQRHTSSINKIVIWMGLNIIVTTVSLIAAELY